MHQGFFNIPVSSGMSFSSNSPTKHCGIHCQLEKGCLSPHMKYSGSGKLEVLVVAEAPGRREDEEGTQLIGSSGQKLRRALRDIGVDLERDCWKTNAIKCRPPHNRTPKPVEIAACRPLLFQEIRRLKPKVIVVLGVVALEAMYGHRWKRGLGGISRWRGFAIPDPGVGCWVCPTYHPSFVARQKKYPAFLTIFELDLKHAFMMIGKKLPSYQIDESRVKCLFDKRMINTYLLGLLERKPRMISIDFETTGVKPHKLGHRIVSCAISEDGKTAAAFPVFEDIKESLTAVLRSHIGKIIANLGFESSWARVLLKTRIKNILWDPMLAAHVIDNRQGITSIKFQALINFGVMDYDGQIHPYLEPIDPKDGNSFNRIDKVPLRQLLIYNGIDALVEYKLVNLQQRRFV